MALTKVLTGGIADDAIGNTKLALDADYAFTGTVSGAGKILQIQYGNHTALTTYSNSFVDVITITITPSVATSLILIRGTIVTHHIQVGQHTAKLVKSGGASGSDALNYEAGDFYHPSGTGVSGNISIQYVDDHNTTNQITYKIQIKAQTGSGVTNKDYDGTQNGVSSLVAMEIAT
jgi:hypothetical protein